MKCWLAIILGIIISVDMRFVIVHNIICILYSPILLFAHIYPGRGAEAIMSFIHMYEIYCSWLQESKMIVK